MAKMSGNTISIFDDYEDVTFLAELDAAEAHALSLSAAKRRRVTLTSSLSPPSFASTTAVAVAAAANPNSDLVEGAYTAALKGSRSLTWQSQTSRSTTAVTAEFSPLTAVGGGGACYKCGLEGHWARDCNVTSSVSGTLNEVVKECACGMGSCVVFTANTERNRGRKFYRCPVRQENGGCGFFEWCDEPSGDHAVQERARDCNVSTAAFVAGARSELAKECPCGLGSCLVLTANTERNRGRKFFKCPVRQENGGCGFFEWCDESSGDHACVQEKALKSGHQQDVYQHPSNKGTTDFTRSRSWDDYNKGITTPMTGYGAVPKFETTDNRSYDVRSGSSCFKCGEEGHWARDCPSTSSNTTTGVREKSSSDGCYKCGQSGHWAKDCSQSQTTKVRYH